MKTLVVLVFAGFMWTFCSKQTIVDPGTEEWKYTAMDSSGTTIVTGTIAFLLPDSGSFYGYCSLQKIGNPQNTGPQSGNRKITGFAGSNRVSINLNPDRADDNVILVVPVKHDQKYILDGTWVWSGFAGIINRGTFILVKSDYED